MKRLWYTNLHNLIQNPIEKQLLQLLQLRHSPKMLWPFYLEPLTNLESPQVSATQESVESVGSEIPDPSRSQHLLFWVFHGRPSPGAKNFHLAASHLLPHQLGVDGQAADSRQNWSWGQHLGTSTWEEKRASLDRLLHEVLKFGRYLDISTNLAPWFCIPSTLVMDIRKDGIIRPSSAMFCPARCRWWVSWWKISGSWWSATSSPGRSTATAPRLGCWWPGVARARRRRGHPKPHHWGKLWMERGDPGRIFRSF